VGDADAPSPEAWPRWATEPVRIVPADPTWASAGATLADDIAARLEGQGVTRVHHVGSTAVPGLDAKPIVDLLAEVPGMAQDPDGTTAAVDAELAHRGWHLVPPALDARPWRRLWVLVRLERRAAHLHLVDPAHERVGDTLAFRDALRDDPSLARRYAALKRRAAAAHPEDREAYTEAKTSFVAAVLRGRS
jgi:GrpB-like predicted nucleotidyltransferase (UPF0157 family)